MGGWVAGRLAAAVFDVAAARATDSLRPDVLNGFDGALCDAFAEAFPGCLLAPLADFSAAVLRVFADGVFAELAADFLDLARAAFPTELLGDFLRVFLDIRLPFVAFGGSIIGIVRMLSGDAGIGPAAGQIR